MISIKPTLKIVTASQAPKDTKVAVVKVMENDHSITYVNAQGQKEIRLDVGKKKEMNRRKLITLVRDVIHAARKAKAKKIALAFPDFLFPAIKAQPAEVAEIIATNLEMANYEYNVHKTPPEKGWDHVVEATVVVDEGKVKSMPSTLIVGHKHALDPDRGSKVKKDIDEAFKRGQTIGQYVNLCRDISNTPAHSLPPMKAAELAQKLSKGTKVKVTVMGEKELTKKGFGGVLAIGQGAKSESAFVVMEYFGKSQIPHSKSKTNSKFQIPNSDRPIVLCGKGVVFDSGGLNIKPGRNMNEMHMDKTGAAATIATVLLAEKLGIKRNIVSLTPFVENMPGHNSIRPGDIIKTLSGKTVQIDNTDAEGRVILSDALTYAKKYKPALLLDVATLTGHMMVALGLHMSGLFCRDEKLGWKVAEMGNEVGDYMWPMPLWDVYESEIKGTYGDITNSSPNRYGGSAEAAMFLYQFAKEANCPWIHFDIASRMTSVESDHLAKGSPGDPVRLLLKIVEEWK